MAGSRCEGSAINRPVLVSLRRSAGFINIPDLYGIRKAKTNQKLFSNLVMDKRPWDLSQTSSNNSRKRTWDSYTTSTDAPSPAGSQSKQQDSSMLNDQSQWRTTRHSLEPQQSPGWESSLQTSLRLTQEFNPGQKGSLTGNLLGHSSQTRLSAPASSRDDNTVPESVAAWSRHPEDDGSQINQERRGSFPRLAPSTAGRDFSYGRVQPTQGFQPRLPDQELASQRSRQTSNTAEFEKGCDRCSQFELFIRNSVTNLTNLAGALARGPWGEVYAKYRDEGVPHNQLPQISNVHRMVDLLEEVCKLSQHLMDTGPVYADEAREFNSSQTSLSPELTASLEDMKNRFLADSQEVLQQGRRDSTGGEYFPTGIDSPRRISPPRPPLSRMTSSLLPPIQGPSPIHTTPDQHVKLPSMQPPPTPGRQLPSPPAYSMPSSSPVLYATTSQSSIHPISPSPSLQPQTPTPAPAAVAAHTAALQHEVSLKSYALQTLQSEHDKLLAALSRSQARARSLEEKQAAADNEVNALSDERLRLIEKTTELETALDDVGKARDEYRMAGVREGQQYVEIVRMASKLEEMAVQERQRLRDRLAAASAVQSPEQERLLPFSGEGASADQPSGDKPSGDMSSNELDLTINPTALAQAWQATIDTQSVTREGTSASHMRELLEEVQQLRRTCEAYESVLQVIRGETRRIDEVIDSVAGPRATIARAFDPASSGKDPPEAQ